MTQEMIVMERALKCVALELPGGVYDDVIAKWVSLKKRMITDAVKLNEVVEDFKKTSDDTISKIEADINVKNKLLKETNVKYVAVKNAIDNMGA